jgi:hypothetical protein
MMARNARQATGDATRQQIAGFFAAPFPALPAIGYRTAFAADGHRFSLEPETGAGGTVLPRLTGRWSQDGIAAPRLEVFYRREPRCELALAFALDPAGRPRRGNPAPVLAVALSGGELVLEISLDDAGPTGTLSRRDERFYFEIEIAGTGPKRSRYADDAIVALLSWLAVRDDAGLLDALLGPLRLRYRTGDERAAMTRAPLEDWRNEIEAMLGLLLSG